MSHRIEIIIGSHNVTGERQLDVITEIVSAHVHSFSCWIGFGVWQGAREACTKVEVFSADIEWVPRCVNELFERLEQEAIEVVIDGREELYWRR